MEFINDAVYSVGKQVDIKYHGVGDSVNGIPMSQAVVITNKE